MIAENFDRRTIAAMEVALERACKRWPNGGAHLLRKRVAQSIIRCAKSGNTGLDALVAAGESAAVEPPAGQSSAWLHRHRGDVPSQLA